MRSEYGEIIDEELKVSVRIPRRLLKRDVKVLDLCSVKIERLK